MSDIDVVTEIESLRASLGRQLRWGTEIVEASELASVEALERWAAGISRTSKRLADTVGDPVRNEVRRSLDSATLDPNTIALEVLRINRGLSLRGLALEADLSAPTVSRIVEQQRCPRPAVAKAIADVWHLGVLELFEIDWTDDTLLPRSVEGVLEAMAETDKEEGPSAWLRRSAWAKDSDVHQL